MKKYETGQIYRQIYRMMFLGCNVSYVPALSFSMEFVAESIQYGFSILNRFSHFFAYTTKSGLIFMLKLCICNVCFKCLCRWYLFPIPVRSVFLSVWALFTVHVYIYKLFTCFISYMVTK